MPLRAIKNPTTTAPIVNKTPNYDIRKNMESLFQIKMLRTIFYIANSTKKFVLILFVKHVPLSDADPATEI